MGKTLRNSIAMMALAMGSASFVWADTATTSPAKSPVLKNMRLLVKSSTFGDKNGDISSDKESKIEYYYYNTDGQIIGTMDMGREFNTTSGALGGFKPVNIEKYVFDANGNPTNKNVYQWGQYDFDDWVWKKTMNCESYVYDESGKLISDTTSTYYRDYTYNDDGTLYQVKRYLKAKKTLSQTFTYSSYDANGNPCHCSSTGAYDSYIYEEDMEYDADGNKVSQYRYKVVEDASIPGLTKNQPVQYEEWTYTDGILSLYVKNSYDSDGNEQPDVKTEYTPVNGDPNVIDVNDYSYFAGTWYQGDLPQRLYYTDFTDMADMTRMDFTAYPDADRANVTDLEFTLPELAFSQACKMCIYRDCAPIDTVNVLDIYDFDSGKCVYKDQTLRNGSYTYFVQPLFGSYVSEFPEEDEEPEWTGYFSTMPVDIEYNTQLPAVSDVRLTGARKEITGTVANLQKIYYAEISWKNPDDIERYGFKKNSIYFEGAGVAELDTADVNADKASVALYDEDVKAYVVTTYDLGNATSESIDVKITDLDKLISTGITTIGSAENRLQVSGRNINLGAASNVTVFNLNGQKVLDADKVQNVALDTLPQSTYIICVEHDGKVSTYKYSVK